MRVRVKPLKGTEFFVDDVELSSTIGQLKERIFQQLGEDFAVPDLKLIIQGKVTTNDKSLEQVGFKEGSSYFVLVVSKKKEKPKAAAPAPAAPTPAAAPVATPAPTNAAPPAQNPAQAGTPFVNPEVLGTLTAMGFAEEDARVALTAAFGDANRAVQYLTNPEELVQLQERQAAAAAQEQQAQPAAGAATPAAAAGGDVLDTFRASPAFQQFRGMVANNPEGIDAVLQRLQAEHADVFQAITTDRGQMMRLIEMLADEEGGGAGNTNPFADNPATGDAGGLDGLDGGEAMMERVFEMMSQLTPEQQQAFLQTMGAPPELAALLQARGATAGGGAPRNVVQLTPDEMQVIGRLEELGFPRNACVEAYISCDKNEQMAANYLLTNMDDIMQEDQAPPPPRNQPAQQNAEGDNNDNQEGGGADSMDEDNDDQDI